MLRLGAVASLLVATLTLLGGVTSDARKAGSEASSVTLAAPPSSNVSQEVSFGLHLSPLSGFGLNLSFPGWVNLSGGELDLGTNVSGSASFAVGNSTNLTFRYGNSSVPISVPALGKKGPFVVPGITYNYSGIELRFELTFSTSVSASGIMGGGGVSTATAYRWNRSTVEPVEIRSATAPTGSVGDHIENALRNLTYEVSIALAATGTVPIVGTITIPLLPLTQVGGVVAAPGNVSANYSVVAPPSITTVRAIPSQVTLGDPVEFSTNASGGVGRLVYSYSTLPPGCLASTTANLTCVPSVAGTFRVNVTVVDADGLRANGSTNVSIVRPSTSASTSGLSVPVWELGAGIAIGVVLGVAAAGVLISRGRSKGPPSP